MKIVILVLIGIAIFAVLPYLLRRIFDKGADAIEHKMNAKRNAKNADKEQNLSDKYK